MGKAIKEYSKLSDIPTVKGEPIKSVCKVSHPVLENIGIKKGDRIDIVNYHYDGNLREPALFIEPTRTFKGVNRPEQFYETHGKISYYSWVTEDGRQYSGDQIYNWTGKLLPDFLDRIKD
jgi:hypothetical protein